ncbi:MAG TPA: 50S ribosomal protein L6 [Anaerolineae bacterium]|nr:50S ribosomal protein L6 [Anaerolineae bacterium]
MARIGKIPVPLPKGVTVTVNKNDVTVKGPGGELSRTFSPDISVKVEDAQIVVSRPSDQRHHKAMHGLVRALVNNMVVGVSKGFSRELEIVGVGYRATMDGKNLVLNVGYSHPIVFEPELGLSFEVEKGGRKLAVKGIDKQVVGEYAARIRKTRPPEPYKGKGVRYVGEHVRRKAGKAGAK